MKLPRLGSPHPPIRRRTVPGLLQLERRELMAGMSLLPWGDVKTVAVVTTSAVGGSLRLSDYGATGDNRLITGGGGSQSRAEAIASYRPSGQSISLGLTTFVDPTAETTYAFAAAGVSTRRVDFRLDRGLLYTVLPTNPGEVFRQPVLVTLRSQFRGSSIYREGSTDSQTEHDYQVGYHANLDAETPSNFLNGSERTTAAAQFDRSGSITFRTTIGSPFGLKMRLSSGAGRGTMAAGSLTLDASIEVLPREESPATPEIPVPTEPAPEPPATPTPTPPMPEPHAPLELRPPELIPLPAVLSTTAPTFQWLAVPGAIGYRLEVVDLTSGLATQVDAGDATSATLPTPLIDGHAYSWTVSAFDRPSEGVTRSGPSASSGRFALAIPDTSAPVVERFARSIGRRGAGSIAITFNEPINASTAGLPGNYAVQVQLGRRYRPVRLRSVVVNSDRTVTITSAGPVGRRQPILVRVGGLIRDLAGNGIGGGVATTLA